MVTHRIFAAILMAGLVSACRSPEPIRPELSTPPSNFFAKESGFPVKIGGLITKHSMPLRKVVMAEGSGVFGFESVSISDNGTIEVVKHTPLNDFDYEKLRVQVPASNLAAFLSSRSCNNARHLRASYSLQELADGGQAFVRLESASASSFTWMNNSYPEEFRNLWEAARELVSSIPTGWKRVARHVDGQEVYYQASGDTRCVH